MNNISNIPVTRPSEPAKISVSQLMSQLMNDLIPLAASHNSFILNNIPKGTLIGTDKDILARSLWNVVYHAINRTRNACIRVDSLFKDQMLVITVDGTIVTIKES